VILSFFRANIFGAQEDAFWVSLTVLDIIVFVLLFMPFVLSDGHLASRNRQVTLLKEQL